MAAELYNKYGKGGYADSSGTLVSTPGITLQKRAETASSGTNNVITVMNEEGRRRVAESASTNNQADAG